MNSKCISLYCLVLNKIELKLKINIYLMIPNFNGYCDLIIEYDCPYAARNLNLILGRDKDICFLSSVFTVIEYFPKFSIVTFALLTNPYC